MKSILKSSLFITLAFLVFAAESKAADKIRCVATLRELMESVRAKDRLSENELPIGRKLGGAVIDAKRALLRREEVGIMGLLSIRQEYFEVVTVRVRGQEIIAYRIRKKSTLRDDLIGVVSDLRKLFKIEDDRNASAKAYAFLLKEFLEDIENHSPRWFEKKLLKYDSFLTTSDITLFDFIDVLVADYAKEHHLVVPDVENAPAGIGARFLSKIGISESTRQFWRKRVINRYANSVVDQTVALPVKIPEILITGIVTAYVVNKFNENDTQEQIEVATTKEKARTVESQKEELQKLITLLNEYNEAFLSEENTINSEGGVPYLSGRSWKVYSEKYIDLGKIFAKFTSSADRLSMDTTTKLVIDTFIKQITKREDARWETLEPLGYTDPEFLARKILLVSLLTGEGPSKSDDEIYLEKIPADAFGNTENHAAFNKAFIAEAKVIASILQSTLDNIVILSE